jgi:DNA (cytosine-5)-methyltransferase 1
MIITINHEHDTAHVVFFEHASKTIMGELHDPNMLFLTSRCDEIPLKMFTGKVNVSYQPHISTSTPPDGMGDYDYYYR